MNKDSTTASSVITAVSFKVTKLLRLYVPHTYVSENAAKLLTKQYLSGIIESALKDAHEFNYLTYIDLKYYIELAEKEEFDYEICENLVFAITEKSLLEDIAHYDELLELLNTYMSTQSVFKAYQKGII